MQAMKFYSSIKKKTKLWSKEMAQWIKYYLYKHYNLNFDLQHPQKTWKVVAGLCNPSLRA